MSDLISRSALLKDLEKLRQDNRHRDARSISQHNAEITACIRRVSIQPAVEAAPVLHGEWEKTRLAGEYQCSNCHSVEYEYLTKSGFKLYDFCPNCGADMRKKVAE